MILNRLLILCTAAMLSGCAAVAVVDTAVSVTTSAVGTAVDVTTGAAGAAVDLVTGEDEEE
ncbi:MAG: hypothetical protein AAF439_10800 [Pseudomonadota bacterium]